MFNLDRSAIEIPDLRIASRCFVRDDGEESHSGQATRRQPGKALFFVIPGERSRP